MQGEDDLRGLAKIMAFMRAVSILLVLMHLYWFCYGYFIDRGWTLELINKGAEDEISTVFKNVVDNAFTYAMISDTQQMDTTKGTLFGAYNAVTGYYQNVRNYKDDEAKLQSIVLGGTAQQKTQKAFELCTAFALDGAEILNLN